MKCDACGGPVVNGKCTYCGKEFPQITPETTSANSGNSQQQPEPRVIEKEKIVYVDRPVVQQEPEPQKKKKEKKKRGCCGTILWVVIILAVIGGVYSYMQKNHDKGKHESRVEETQDQSTSSSETTVTSTKETQAQTQTQTQAPAEATSADGVNPEFKESMDAYEKFMNEYCDFMESYNADDPTMLVKYTKYMADYTDTMEKLDAIDETQLSAADDAYYIEVMGRINTRLAKVAANG